MNAPPKTSAYAQVNAIPENLPIIDAHASLLLSVPTARKTSSHRATEAKSGAPDTHHPSSCKLPDLPQEGMYCLFVC